MTDDALIEAMAQAICDDHNEGMVPMLHSDWEDWKEAAEAALAVARPIIREQERELLAKKFETLKISQMVGADIAYIIRNMSGDGG